MKFTKDDLKDGMVCTMRDGDTYVYLGDVLTSLHSNISDMTRYTDTLTATRYTSKDIMKITYGGKTVFEREEWRELTIDEAFELLKKGPIKGTGTPSQSNVPRVMELTNLCPYSEEPYRTVGFSAQKFRIKK